MNNPNYTTHRLANFNEILKYLEDMGPTEFWPYAERLHKKIQAMKPGEEFVVDDVVLEENRDLFIKLLCNFMNEYPGRWLFNETYTVFYRLKPQPKFHSIYENQQN